MLIKRIQKLSCDVLIIGGGGAGLRTAIAARMCNADVILTSKTRIGACSNTYISKAIIAATGWGVANDNENAHIVDTVRGGCFLNDQSMVSKVAQRVHSETKFLKDCGVHFGMRGDRPHLLKVPGHRNPRHVYGANWSGRDLVVPLRHRAKQVGVRFAEQVFVTRLMADASRVCGAAGIAADGRFFAIHAKTVVLATGGYAQIYLNTNNVPGITGDGQALAYDLGVPLKDMEFVQFYPTARGNRGSRLILYETLMAQPGVTLCNRQGQNILKKHGIADSTKVTRDHLAQLISHAIQQGASSDQAVFLNTEAISEDTARQLASILPPRWWKGEKVFKVAPTAHFCMGGIVTDQWGETAVKGLFAVGEAAAGVHGANRLGGNALAEIFSMGSLVGEKVVQRAVAMETVSFPKSAFEGERARLDGAYANQGVSVKPLISELKRLVWHKAGVIREESGLKEVLEHIGASLPPVLVTSPTDLIKLLEFRNMRTVAEMVCRAALERTESRGSHFRSDYPEENNPAWMKNILLKKTSTGTGLETSPVNLDLVKLEC